MGFISSTLFMPMHTLCTQTVLKTQEALSTQESTYKTMYDSDLGLIRSEKEALLRYMRESVKENGDFLQRIRELEEENSELLREQSEYNSKLESVKEGYERELEISRSEIIEIQQRMREQLQEEEQMREQLITEKRDLQQKLDTCKMALKNSNEELHRLKSIPPPQPPKVAQKHDANLSCEILSIRQIQELIFQVDQLQANLDEQKQANGLLEQQFKSLKQNALKEENQNHESKDLQVQMQKISLELESKIQTIALLEKQLAEQGGKNCQLQETIQQLEKQLKESGQQLNSSHLENNNHQLH